jgi:hypothetical protein
LRARDINTAGGLKALHAAIVSALTRLLIYGVLPAFKKTFIESANAVVSSRIFFFCCVAFHFFLIQTQRSRP